jgi:hypothetical protein
MSILNHHVRFSFYDSTRYSSIVNQLTPNEYEELKKLFSYTQNKDTLEEDHLEKLYQEAGKRIYVERRDASLHSVHSAFVVLRRWLMMKYKEHYTQQELNEIGSCRDIERTWRGIGNWQGS